MGYDQGMKGQCDPSSKRSMQLLCPLKNLSWFEHFSSPCDWASSGRAHLLSLATFSVESRGVILSYQWKVWRPNPWLWLLGGVWLWLCHLFPTQAVSTVHFPLPAEEPSQSHGIFSSWADCWQFCGQMLWLLRELLPRTWFMDFGVSHRFLLVVWRWAVSSKAQHLIYPQMLAVVESFYFAEILASLTI